MHALRTLAVALIPLVFFSCRQGPREHPGDVNSQYSRRLNPPRQPKDPGIRTVIATVDSPRCSKLTAEINKIYGSLRSCSSDLDCIMFMACDAISAAANAHVLERLLEDQAADCAPIHGPCQQANAAFCEDNRCVPKYE
jgi:hypothetical protein